MKNFTAVLFLFIMLIGSSCEEKGYPKPEGLIKQKEMVNILYDIHLGEALANRNRYAATDSTKIKSEDVYQAVLNKYGINDSIMSLSVIYYSARPKVYEKIYTQVVERLNLKIEAIKQKRDVTVQSPDKEE
ncbi:DUF4296 domain-containing protein [Mangrovibacterium lignilyticum]|uniref:DUF4296 domain-containing protein n=1 Tax=Mangrovibacterium lignilyticum TaxID=2668052 RepID=UPI0013D7B435|nr:DUF4296 domain-containing protein [Mangrovibacterium lignilyticum]